MKTIQNKTFDQERALYGERDIKVVHCAFDGPADGESAFKEGADITAERCFFNLRYPFWHDHGLVIRDSEMTQLCRAALWYSHHIEITGFQRKLSLNNIKRNIVTLWNLALSGPKAKAIMKEVKPDLVIGCGGYVSGPVVRCAAKMGIHTAIHEQNAFPGMTNKLLAPDVDIVFAAVPAAVEKLGAPEKTVVVGNPVRPEVFTKAKERDAIRAELGAGDRTVILSFGGSLGARRVNEVVADLCAWEQHEHKPVLHLHATGQYGVQLFKDLETEKNFAEGDSLVVKEYINNMPELLAAADLVISRAGALTLAELEAVGRAAVLIPSPNVAENHQYFNAMELQKAGAAVVIEEKDLTGEKLVATVSDMLARQAGRDGPERPQPVGG